MERTELIRLHYLARELDITFRFTFDRDGDGPPPPWQLVEDDGHPWWFVMDHAANGGTCPFLSAERRCRIYEHRPSACRSYPASPMPRCLAWPAES